jgi:3-methyl-2-oxobutanoate hydroxymethyltransferase
VDVLLVGDSLGMVLQGHNSTLPVTLDDMAYHTACVARGAAQAFIVADLPFGTFQVNPEKTFEHAARLMAAGANMVKLEGGETMAETIAFLTRRGDSGVRAYRLSPAVGAPAGRLPRAGQGRQSRAAPCRMRGRWSRQGPA